MGNLLKQINNYRQNSWVIIASVLIAEGLDWTFNIRSNLIMVSGILLIHIFPTLFIPHHLFDKKREWLASLVYIYAGPIGLGVMIHSFSQNIWMDHTVPEGVTPSVGVLIGLTVAVLLSYWDSGTMSRTARREEARSIEGVMPTGVLLFLHALDTIAQHCDADELRKLIGRGFYQEAVDLFTDIQRDIKADEIAKHIVDQASRDLCAMLRQSQNVAE